MADLIRSFHYKNWEEVFEKNLTSGVKTAFEIAQNDMQQKIGMPYYSSFESFKSSRTWRKKNKKR